MHGREEQKAVVVFCQLNSSRWISERRELSGKHRNNFCQASQQLFRPSWLPVWPVSLPGLLVLHADTFIQRRVSRCDQSPCSGRAALGQSVERDRLQSSSLHVCKPQACPRSKKAPMPFHWSTWPACDSCVSSQNWNYFIQFGHKLIKAYTVCPCFFFIIITSYLTLAMI